MRTRYRPIASGLPKVDLEVFNVRQRLVIEIIADFSGEVVWSADGEQLVMSRGRSVVFHRVVGFSNK